MAEHHVHVDSTDKIEESVDEEILKIAKLSMARRASISFLHCRRMLCKKLRKVRSKMTALTFKV